MTDRDEHYPETEDEALPGPAPQASDATQADMGLDAGTGATADQATDDPRGADPQEGTAAHADSTGDRHEGARTLAQPPAARASLPARAFARLRSLINRD